MHLLEFCCPFHKNVHPRTINQTQLLFWKYLKHYSQNYTVLINDNNCNFAISISCENETQCQYLHQAISLFNCINSSKKLTYLLLNKLFINKLESIWFFYSLKRNCCSLSHIYLFSKTTKTLRYFKVFLGKLPMPFC